MIKIEDQAVIDQVWALHNDGQTEKAVDLAMRHWIDTMMNPEDAAIAKNSFKRIRGKEKHKIVSTRSKNKKKDVLP